MAFARVTITIGAMQVCIESDQPYPDAIQDMANRAVQVAGNTLAQVKACEIDLMDVYDFEPDEEDD